MKPLYLIIISVFFTLAVSAQSKGTITGKVTDATTKAAVDYATVSIFSQGSTKPLNGSLSDAKGNFTVGQLPFGEYQVQVNFVGYKKQIIDHVIINNNKPVVNIGNVVLTETQQTLNTVTVTARAATVENRIDKMVYNAGNDITSQNGMALDVLKKVPQVTVDIDGNVELQGNTNIRFLINGKPSSIFGNSLADALATIPASQIKSIEVITSPGAKYDAEGTGGIINIILKDNKVQGVNGNVNLSAGTRMENGSANLNVRKGNFGVSAFFSGNGQINTKALSYQDRTSSDATTNTNNSLIQDGYSNFRRSGYQSGLSFDWNVTPRDNLTGGISFNHFGNHSTSFINQDQQTEYLSNHTFADILSTQNSINKFSANSVDWNLNYKKTFSKEGQELDILYSSSFGNNHSNYAQEQNYLGNDIPFGGSNSTNPGTDRQTNISVDYAQPISKKITIETGAKTTIQTINSEADINTLNAYTNVYVPDATQSYHLYYNRDIYAYYLSGNFNLFNYLDVKAGARYEHTDTKVDFANTDIPSYNTFVPSIIFSHKINDLQTVKISYTRRIERPGYREINPFLNMADQHNITTGNPLLKPETGDMFELGYNRSFEKGGNFYISLFSRHNHNDVKPYTTFYPTFQVGDSVYHDVAVSNRQNIGSEQNTGINFSGSLPVSSKLNLRTNLSLINRYVMINYLGSKSSVNSLVYRLNLNATYQLSSSFVAEAFGNYNSASTNIQGRQPQFFSYNFAFRKQFLNKNASIGFTTTNPFGKYVKQVTTINGDGFNTYNERQIPLRSFGISVMYKFGKLEFKKTREENNNIPNPID